MEGTYHFLIY